MGLTVTNNAAVPLRWVEWGAEYLHYNPASPWSLILDSDSLVTSGFAGTQTTLAGAYDPNATGNSIITSVVASSAQAICGTGAQPHIGTFRVKARINTGPGGCNAVFRFAWRTGDGSYTTNDPVSVSDTVQEYRAIDLGLITIPVASAGTQAWDGRLEAWSSTGGDTLFVDYLLLIPVEAGYGKATATYSYTPGVIVARDSFAGLGSGVALNARTPDAGAAWITAGVATDFVGSTAAETTTILPRAARLTNVVEATPRVAVLGSAMTDQEVAVATYTTGVTWAPRSQGVISRYVDTSNYLRLQYRVTGAGTTTYLDIIKKIAGVETTLASGVFTNVNLSLLTLRLVVYASGRAIGTASSGAGSLSLESTDSTLATGGALASGKAGLFDQFNSTNGAVRKFDDIAVLTPSPEPIAIYPGRQLEITSSDTIRESSAGGTWGRPQSYRGGRFRVNPAGDADRTTRLVVIGHRNDLDNGGAWEPLDDSLTLAASFRPRCSVVPRA